MAGRYTGTKKLKSFSNTKARSRSRVKQTKRLNASRTK